MSRRPYNCTRCPKCKRNSYCPIFAKFVNENVAACAYGRRQIKNLNLRQWRSQSKERNHE